MKTRSDLLNFLAVKYNLQRYLEIGVQVPALNFDKVKCVDKIGVDPDPLSNADFVMTSDEFFELVQPYSGKSEGPMGTEVADKLAGYFVMMEDFIKKTVSYHVKFDLIFIDGLHTAEQVKKDFDNALKILSPSGFIVLHDCNPIKEEHTIVPRPTERGHWNGDVWRFAVALYGVGNIARWTVDIDNGCMVFQNGSKWRKWKTGISEMAWSEFDKKRKKYLNLVSWDEFISSHSHV